MLSNFHVYVALFNPELLLSVVFLSEEQLRYDGIASSTVTLYAIPPPMLDILIV